jgi:hypothetical protein
MARLTEEENQAREYLRAMILELIRDVTPTRAMLRQLIRQLAPTIIREILDEDVQTFTADKLLQKQDWVTMKILIKELSMSRQTIYNWRNDIDKRLYLENYIRTENKTLFFDLIGFKDLIKTYPSLFGIRTNEKMQYSGMNDEQKKQFALGKIKEKIAMKVKLTKDEKRFYNINRDRKLIINPFP